MQATIPGAPVPAPVPEAAKPKRVVGPAEQRLRDRIVLTRRIERLVAKYDARVARHVLIDVQEAIWAICAAQEENRAKVEAPIA
jgi:hypothetical protein